MSDDTTPWWKKVLTDFNLGFNLGSAESQDNIVFSLGQPLPHVPRWNKVPPLAPQSSESLVERGEGNSNQPDREKEENATQNEHSSPGRTPAGVTHTGQHNDAGEPIYSHQPEHNRPERRERTDDTINTTKSNRSGPNPFAVVSEPIGGRDHTDREKNPDEDRNWWAKIRARHPEPLAEFLATGIAVLMGLGSTLSVNLSADQDIKYGSYETTCWAWGFAWMLGIYLAGGVSGAHMNPAISICFSIFRGFPWKRCVVYISVQFVAGIVAGALAYGIYRDTILHVDPTMTTMAQTFFSTPQEWVSRGSAFFDQTVGSAIMMIAVLALGDDQNNPPGAGMHAFVLGLLVTALKFTLGYNIGSALNPASDFGPRLIAWAVGYRGPEVWKSGWFALGPCFGTLVGSVAGCVLYDALVFTGPESPINYKRKGPTKDRIRKKFRKVFCLNSSD